MWAMTSCPTSNTSMTSRTTSLRTFWVKSGTSKWGNRIWMRRKDSRKSTKPSWQISWECRRSIYELRWTKNSAKRTCNSRRWSLSWRAEWWLVPSNLATTLVRTMAKAEHNLRWIVTTVSTVRTFHGRQICGNCFLSTRRRSCMRNKLQKSPNSWLMWWSMRSKRRHLRDRLIFLLSFRRSTTFLCLNSR